MGEEIDFDKIKTIVDNHNHEWNWDENREYVKSAIKKLWKDKIVIPQDKLILKDVHPPTKINDDEISTKNYYAWSDAVGSINQNKRLGLTSNERLKYVNLFTMCDTYNSDTREEIIKSGEIDKYKLKDEQLGISHHCSWFPRKNDIMRIVTAIRQVAAKLNKNTDEMVVLDIGCDNGLISYLLAEQGLHIIGIEPAQSIKFEHKNLSYITTDAEHAIDEIKKNHPTFDTSSIIAVINSWMPSGIDFTRDIVRINAPLIIYVSEVGGATGTHDSYRTYKKYTRFAQWYGIAQRDINLLVKYMYKKEIVTLSTEQEEYFNKNYEGYVSFEKEENLRYPNQQSQILSRAEKLDEYMQRINKLQTYWDYNEIQLQLRKDLIFFTIPDIDSTTLVTGSMLIYNGPTTHWTTNKDLPQSSNIDAGEF